MSFVITLPFILNTISYIFDICIYIHIYAKFSEVAEFHCPLYQQCEDFTLKTVEGFFKLIMSQWQWHTCMYVSMSWIIIGGDGGSSSSGDNNDDNDDNP